MPRYQCSRTLLLVGVLAIIGAAVATPAWTAAAPDRLGLRFQAGQLLGLRVGGTALPSTGLGGFYVQPYRVVTGPNLLRERSIAGLPRPLPRGFVIDSSVTWQGKPTLSIKLPGDRPADSGELDLHLDSVQPHHVYLLRFAHRGQRLGGEYPPILHLRQLDAEGKPAWSQLNIDLLNGTYDWKEEVIAVPAMAGAVQFALMLHHPGGTGQFWISEIAAVEVKQQPVASVPGNWSEERQPRFSGTIPGTPITLSAQAAPSGDAITMHTALSAPASWLRRNPTSLIVSFRLPIAAQNWRWGDYLRRERRVEATKTYSYYQLLGRRQFRQVSKFPMAEVAGPRHGVALMIPLKPTLLSRLRYDADGYLCVEFDLGMADRGRGDTESVSFSFDIVRFDPRWGYRGALAAYYARYPALFSSSAEEGGWWIGPSDQVKNLHDFGLQYAEAHFARPESTGANNKMGVYTCSYSEPWMWRIPVSDEKDTALAKPLSSYLIGIERGANLPPTAMDIHDYWTVPRRDSVSAFLSSAIFGTDGKYEENAVRTYAATFIEMNTSPLPSIRSDRWGAMNRGLLSYRYETLADIERCAAGGAKIDGVYFDSVGDWSDISAEDHRADHFAFASYPLTFSYATGTPVISGLAAMAEYMEFIRAKNLITMANSDSTYAAFAAPFLDMIGAGENYSEESGADAELSHDRAVAYHKSVSFGNSGMLSVSPAEAEERFRRLLFYHVYPGIFFSDEAALEKVRPVYLRYVPLMREMGRAGWEPVPWASAPDGSLWIERYGPRPGGPAYFAIRNPGSVPRSSSLTIEAAGFGRPAVAGIRAFDALTGNEIACQRSVNKLLLPIRVPAQDTVVVRLEWPQ